MYPTRRVNPYQYAFPQLSPAQRQSMGIPRGQTITQPGPQQQYAPEGQQLNAIGNKVGNYALRKAMAERAAPVDFDAMHRGAQIADADSAYSSQSLLDSGADPEVMQALQSGTQYQPSSLGLADTTAAGMESGLGEGGSQSLGLMGADEIGAEGGMSVLDSSAAGGAAAEGAAEGGAGAGMGAYATPLGYAALIASGKMIEHGNPDSTTGRTLLSMLGPSYNQIAADPKIGLTTALGAPWLNGFIRNDRSAHANPEWAGLFSMFG